MKNETIRAFAKKYDETREQTIDIDAVLPDYYPEVNQILKCSAVLSVESVTSTGDKLSVAGEAQTSIIFTGDNGEIHVYEASQKYTKVIRCESLADGDRFFVSQEVTRLNFKATGPRRLEIRASAAVRVVVYSIHDDEYVSDFEDNTIEQACECFNAVAVACADRASFEITDTVKLPDGVTNESEVLNAAGELFIRETRVIKNKVMMKGNCTAEFITVQPDGSVKKFNADIPFTEIKDMYGASEDDICSVSASCKNLRLALKAVSGGDEAAFSAECEAVVFTSKNVSYTVANDAFSLIGEARTETAYAQTVRDIASVDTTSAVVFDAETYDAAPTELLAVFADNIRFGCVSGDGNAKLNGTCTLNAVLKNADGKIFIVGRTAGFECPLPDADEWFVSVACSRISAELSADGKVSFSATFSVKGFAVALENKLCVSCCKPVANSDAKQGSGIAIYYAREGEKIWNIAKENKCRVSLLKDMNGIDSDETTESRVVIFPVGV